MNARPAVFAAGRRVFRADTCETVRRAAERGEIALRALAHGSYPGRRLAPQTLPEVCSVGYWDVPRAASWGLDWHRNEGIEFTYVSRGRTAFAVEGRESMLRRGHLTVTRPWQTHRVGNPNVGASRLHWLILDVGVRRPHQPWRWPDWLVCSPADLRSLTTLLRHNEQAVWAVGEAVGSAFERIAAAVDGWSGPSPETRIKLEINGLLVALHEILTRRRVPLDRRLIRAERTVRMFLADLARDPAGPWTLDSMAEECGLGRTRFAHYCRQIANTTALEYLARCRVEAAARLLRARPGMSVTEVALASGFSSSQYFATVFRKFLGRSPREVRKARPAGNLARSATVGSAGGAIRAAGPG
jgi:AraC family L-rhamnose operon regulatory protein RhaS